MTLNEAIFDLHQHGLSCPTAISVFFLYKEEKGRYRKDDLFEVKFTELLKIQETIEQMYHPPVSSR